MKALVSCIALLFTLHAGLQAQEIEYNTDDLKKLSRITDQQWSQAKDASAKRASQFLNTSKGDATAFGRQGYTVISRNQTLKLDKEVNAVYDYVASAGQDESGKVSQKARVKFKIGPGTYEVKDYVITRIEGQ